MTTLKSPFFCWFCIPLLIFFLILLIRSQHLASSSFLLPLKYSCCQFPYFPFSWQTLHIFWVNFSSPNVFTTICMMITLITCRPIPYMSYYNFLPQILLYKTVLVSTLVLLLILVPFKLLILLSFLSSKCFLNLSFLLITPQPLPKFRIF